jgi:hypothetical protein
MEEDTILGLKPHNTHSVECYSKDGVLKWSEEIPNLVTEEGAVWLLDNAFGPGLHREWRAGLVESGTISTQDTMVTHNWVEFTKTTHASRPSLSFNESDPKTAHKTYTSEKAGFIMHKEGHITGTFMVDDPLMGGRMGLLYGVTHFTDIQTVVPGDSIYLIINLGSKL